MYFQITVVVKIYQEVTTLPLTENLLIKILVEVYCLQYYCHADDMAALTVSELIFAEIATLEGLSNKDKELVY